MIRYKNLLRLLAAMAAVVLLCGIFVSCAEKAETPAELLSLGEKYLTELDYENAIVQFLKVIEVEPMNERAYVGAAEAYLHLGDTDKAIEVLERGLSALPDSGAIGSMLEELKPRPLTPQEIEAVERQEFRSEFLEELHALFESGMVDDALALVNNTSDFAAQCEDVGEANPDLYLPEGKKGIGIYKAAPSKFGNYYIYYGDFADGIRSGSGFWAIVNNEEYYLFDGEWSGDAPNGYGEVKEWYGELHEEMMSRQKKGVLSNGLWNGSMEWIFIYPDRTHVHPVYFTEGIVTTLKEFTTPDNELYYYVSENMSFPAYNIELRHGIAGFEGA